MTRASLAHPNTCTSPLKLRNRQVTQPTTAQERVKRCEGGVTNARRNSCGMPRTTRNSTRRHLGHRDCAIGRTETLVNSKCRVENKPIRLQYTQVGSSKQPYPARLATSPADLNASRQGNGRLRGKRGPIQLKYFVVVHLSAIPKSALPKRPYREPVTSVDVVRMSLKGDRVTMHLAHAENVPKLVNDCGTLAMIWVDAVKTKRKRWANGKSWSRVHVVVRAGGRLQDAERT
ncbi:hypothetical protein DFP72DRAFT_886385 [Ephemerocybe angulata]|uniref:Uncharacterized protein n=1 Tax=Ephemerocybe angulata TaxID=980116 RepID=A0A8H6MAE5_9AGAR|nr:hypothetical protein DFP72DRAFT_886385 [Tulosesus angulatus]